MNHQGKNLNASVGTKVVIRTTLSYIASGFIGILLTGPIGIFLGPLIRKLKKKNWGIWILILFPLQYPLIGVALILHIHPVFFMSPFTMQGFYRCQFNYGSIDSLTPEEQMNSMRQFVEEKESSCSTSKHYLATKSVVLLGEGNFEGSLNIVNDLESKNPNDPTIQKVRQLITKAMESYKQ